jgi:predicted SpoU family rRNA methylase
MSQTVHVEAARIPDRDRLLATLQEHGLTARPLGEVEIEIPLDSDDAGDEVYAQVEQVVMTLGAPFVPIKHEGVIYVRPPVG